MRSRYASGGAVRATRPLAPSICVKFEVFLLALASPGSHLQMQIRAMRRVSGRASEAVLAAIGRMRLTSAIMKFQAPFSYTEYRDMFG